jgi:hypothetical protein
MQKKKTLTISESLFNFLLKEVQKVKILEKELESSKKYADKLAATLPIGGLPKDLKNLQNANTHLAEENFRLNKTMEEITRKSRKTKKLLLKNSKKLPKNKRKKIQKILQSLHEAEPKKNPKTNKNTGRIS